ncbi:hypothetical protein J7E88_34400 [Streptomyces sp. ISL-10]|uniref:hypothetical protein n=1 Tax=Streptomyces sp. ISL-10 TaxID=2819172 RepID=UPI001BE968C6|nr:hypothetical protein [Streptomyces sp. ISL-10]MBT2370229.1 hypothetical protein [Streptomyces sp. ISL-10]
MQGAQGEIRSAGPAGSTTRQEGWTAGGTGSLVILAVEDGDPEFAKAIDEQLSVVTQWWGTDPTMEPGFVQTMLRAPQERHEVEMFLHTSGIRETAEDEPLVVYITSHGAIGTSNRHFLILPGTDHARLLATAMPTNEVVTAALDSWARHVLVIVNTCEAEGIDVELKALVRDLARTRTEGTLNVLATTSARSQVMGREFALILRMASEWLQDAAGITRPHLSTMEFLHALEHATERLNEERRLALPGPRAVQQARLGVPSPTLPNPGYRPRPRVVTGAREEVSADYDELEYWLDRASGRVDSDDPRWYFSGRRELNRQVVRFLSGPAGVLVVTGTAASGKSAVLARAVTLSDPTFRSSPRYAGAVSNAPADGVPPAGSVDAAVSARNRGATSLIEAIGSRLGCEPDRSRPALDPLRQWQEGLRAFFRGDGDTVTVVVDSLDESSDPTACIRDVLAPLARHVTQTAASGAATIPAQAPCPAPDAAQPTGFAPDTPAAPCRGLRLLLGIRSSRPGQPGITDAESGGLLGELRHAFPRAEVLRTDGESALTDVAAYITALLSGTALDTDAAAVDSAAARVAAHVGRSFLDARLAAEQLRRSGGEALLSDPLWFSQLDRGTAGILEQDLDMIADDGLDKAEAVALLRATAFGLGRGMPWAQLWPAVAEALLGAPIKQADEKIRRLLESRIAGYLTHDTEDDRVVYRPAHEQLAAVLRRWR